MGRGVGNDWLLYVFAILWWLGGYFFTRGNKKTYRMSGRVDETNGWPQYCILTLIFVGVIVFILQVILK